MLLADPEAGVIGAAHAGWRGALDGVLEATLAAMERLGARTASVRAAVGPTISQRAYEVGPEFLKRFQAEEAGYERFFASGRGDRLNFDLPGFVLNPYAYMARAAVLAVSSAHEGFCNVLVEAMACGCPVVSTDCPSGPAEILDGGRFGRLVPVGDDRALAAAIAGTLDAPRDPNRLRMRARFFSLDRAVEQYERLLLGDGPLEQLSPMPRTRIVEPGSLPWRKGVPSAGGPV